MIPGFEELTMVGTLGDLVAGCQLSRVVLLLDFCLEFASFSHGPSLLLEIMLMFAIQKGA